MKKLFEEMMRLLTSGKDLVLVSVIEDSGSTPRGAGARMIVSSDGFSMGTIGGGALEYKAGQLALDVLENKGSYSRGFRLSKGQEADLGMICGGEVVIYFQFVGADDRDFYGMCEKAAEAFDRDEDCWLITDITDETAWSMVLYGESQKLTEYRGISVELLCRQRAVQVESEGRLFYSEPLVKAGNVLVFGGGHVAQELVPVLNHLGFRCVVIDDRKEFANRELFPDAADTIVCDFERISEYLNVRERDYAVIMTRGHQCDYILQRQMLKTPVCYIGVMGSRKKAGTLAGKLREEGFGEEEISRIHTPIGLEIEAETPAEIAISVAGELIAVRAHREGAVCK